MTQQQFFWEPENQEFWEKNKGFAYRTIVISFLALHLAFAVWFMWSALVVRLPGLGFNLTVEQRFWLPAISLLMGAVARFPHTFLVLKIGGRNTTAITTALMFVPIFGIAIVVQDPTTSFGTLLFWAGMAGLAAGGQISSSSANINLWFPKRLSGTALGVNVGLGNLGTSSAQFLIPLAITAGIFGALAGDPMTFSVINPKTKEIVKQLDMWPQNAAYIWLVPTIIITALVWFGMKNHPARGSFGEQFKILKLKHTWITTILYTMTFGSFSGFAGALPTLIREVFGHLPDAPDPLKYAFLGPLVGALIRPVGGILSDKFSGGRVTTVVAFLFILSAIGVTFTTSPTSADEFGIFISFMLLIFAAAGLGNASVFKQITMIFPPKQSSPVLGFSAAMAVLVFGFFVPILLGRSIAETGSPNTAFFGFTGFYAVCLFLNWYYYRRAKAEVSC